MTNAALDADVAPVFPATAAGPSQKLSLPRMSAIGALTGQSVDTELLHAPDPVGHFMLVALPEIESRVGNIHVPDEVSARERTASVIGKVLEMGPDCYRDPEPTLPAGLPNGVAVTVVAPRPRFPSGPWCKKGDVVLFSRYAGKRFRIEGIEFRMLADDEVIATVPEGAHVGGL